MGRMADRATLEIQLTGKVAPSAFAPQGGAAPPSSSTPFVAQGAPPVPVPGPPPAFGPRAGGGSASTPFVAQGGSPDPDRLREERAHQESVNWLMRERARRVDELRQEQERQKAEAQKAQEKAEAEALRQQKERRAELAALWRQIEEERANELRGWLDQQRQAVAFRTDLIRQAGITTAALTNPNPTVGNVANLGAVQLENLSGFIGSALRSRADAAFREEGSDSGRGRALTVLAGSAQLAGTALGTVARTAGVVVENLKALGQGIAPFSGVLSAAQVNSQIRDMQTDMMLANRYGDDLARLTDVSSRMENQLKILGTDIAVGIFRFFEPFLNNFAGGLEAANWFGKWDSFKYEVLDALRGISKDAEKAFQEMTLRKQDEFKKKAEDEAQRQAEVLLGFMDSVRSLTLPSAVGRQVGNLQMRQWLQGRDQFDNAPPLARRFLP